MIAARKTDTTFRKGHGLLLQGPDLQIEVAQW